MKTKKDVYEFLKGKVFYIATVDAQNNPKVRPFGAVGYFNEQLYICTNSTKDVFKQMKANPNIEIAAMADDNRWFRLTAQAVCDDNAEMKKQMLNEYPNIKEIYSGQEHLFEVLYLQDATARLIAHTGETEMINF